MEDAISPQPQTTDPNTPLPKVLILKPPSIFLRFEPEFSRHFHFFKAYESPLPLPDFLAAATAAGVSALFITGVGPKLTAEILDLVPSLRCIVSGSAGVDFVDLNECHRRGISVANAADFSSTDVADYAVALLFAVLRKVSGGDRFVRGGEWGIAGDFSLGRRVGAKRIGIVGYGSIGSKVAKRMEGFGCCVLYSSREKKPSVPYPFYSDVCELAANSDVLIICCALTDHTRHMINKQVLTALGKEGVIVNIARGPVIDEKELIKFLLEGQIAGAGLDVFEHEPTVPKELFSLDNVVLSPHVAIFTEQCFSDLFEHVKANLLAFFSNEPLLSPVV